MVEFRGWPKIARLNREVIITEKIDGTNACVIVTDDGEVHAQSRKRLIFPYDDNFGFATWVEKNAERLREGLGVGYHFGEWYGSGIQRKYGMTDRRFALFNVGRWGALDTFPHLEDNSLTLVPTIAQCYFHTEAIETILSDLEENGSLVAGGLGFPKPEGIVVYHKAGNVAFKVTIEDDEKPKGG